MYSSTSEGNTVPLYDIYAGECVSEAALFANSYCSDVRAESASRVRVFAKEDVLKALLESPKLAETFMNAQAKRFNALRVRMELLNLRSAKQRLLQYLAALGIADSQHGLMSRPLKQIADELGLSHASFYRTLAQLVREGAVKRENRSIRLAAPEILF